LFPRAISLRVDDLGPSLLRLRPEGRRGGGRFDWHLPPRRWSGGANYWALTERPPRRLHRTGCDRSPDDGRTGKPSSLFRPDRTGAVSDTGAGPPPLRWAKATAGRSAGGRPYCIQPARCFRPPNGRQQQAPLRSPWAGSVPVTTREGSGRDQYGGAASTGDNNFSRARTGTSARVIPGGRSTR
jgi:hypothetical protein